MELTVRILCETPPPRSPVYEVFPRRRRRQRLFLSFHIPRSFSILSSSALASLSDDSQMGSFRFEGEDMEEERGSSGIGGEGSSPNDARRARSVSHNSRMECTNGSGVDVGCCFVFMDFASSFEEVGNDDDDDCAFGDRFAPNGRGMESVGGALLANTRRRFKI